jgi:excinuclease ABC subunit C
VINISDKLKNKLNTAPKKPGIYKMLDSKGNVIYVGKSKMLNKRIKTYFANNPKWEKVIKMVPLIDDIEYIVTDTHLEARLLECSLIKSIKPIFNSQMKHDRGYVYLKLENYNRYRALSVIDSREEFSYGPFRRKFHLNETINIFKNLYPIKKTDNSYEFEYHLFPVTLNKDMFNENRNSLKEILSDYSKANLFINELENKMRREASLNNFEMASLYKDIINNVNFIIYSINKYNELVRHNILLTIPIEEGYKLFYISKGKIKKKEIYKKMTQTDIEVFSETALTSTEDNYDLDEKSLMDFKDIVYSEIISLPESMVKYI